MLQDKLVFNLLTHSAVRCFIFSGCIIKLVTDIWSSSSRGRILTLYGIRAVAAALVTLNDLPSSIVKLVSTLLITYLFTRVINVSCFVTLVRQSNYNWHPLLQINGWYVWKSNTWSLCFMWRGRPEKNPDFSWTLNKLSRENKCQPHSHLERGNEKLAEFMLHLCCQMAANSRDGVRLFLIVIWECEERQGICERN